VATTQLLDLLGARTGLVCTVGAGGKKTTLYRLLGCHPGRVALTSTVFIPPFPKDLNACIIREEHKQLLTAVQQAANANRRIGYTGVITKKGRFEGVPAALVQEIHEQIGFEVTLIKADGARTRMIKAPDEDEPQLPAETTTVIPVISARAVGQPLSERIAHRVDRIEHVTDARAGETLTALHVARLLASEEGLLKNVGDARVVPVINMVDDDSYRAIAREVAERALELTKRFDTVVLACMRNADPLIAVVQR
jgi:probable selenium-dependent hydroxylase accessory protein YqeC